MVYNSKIFYVKGTWPVSFFLLVYTLCFQTKIKLLICQKLYNNIAHQQFCILFSSHIRKKLNVPSKLTDVEMIHTDAHLERCFL